MAPASERGVGLLEGSRNSLGFKAEKEQGTEGTAPLFSPAREEREAKPNWAYGAGPKLQIWPMS